MGNNVEIVLRVTGTSHDFITGDREPFERAVKELMSEDVLVMPSSGLASGTSGPFRGHAGVFRQHTAIASLWPNFTFVIDEIVEVPPNTVVLIGRVSANRANGVGYAAEIGMVWRLEDGRIASVHSYESKRRALEEAGAADLPAPGRSE
jgi:ketosteroid isomerase-like protein